MNLQHIQTIGKAISATIKFAEGSSQAVRADIRTLAEELSQSIRSLADLMQDLSRNSEGKNFEDEFREKRRYFDKFYYGQINMSKARTHCADLRRTVGRIQHKIGCGLVTEFGSWDKVTMAISKITDNDDRFADDYRATIERIHQDLEGIDRSLKRSPDVAMRKYKKLMTSMRRSLDSLQAVLESMADGEAVFARHVGS